MAVNQIRSQVHKDEIEEITEDIVMPNKSRHFYVNFVEMTREQSLSYFRLENMYYFSGTKF